MASTPSTRLSSNGSQSGSPNKRRDSIPRELRSPSIRGEETESPSPTRRPDNDESIITWNTNDSSDASVDSGGASVDSSDEDAVEEAQKVIEDSYRGHLVPHYPTFSFRDERSYGRLRRKLQDGDSGSGLLEYFEGSLRTDWDAVTGELTLRVMPTALHETVQTELVRAIERQLDRVAGANRLLSTARPQIRNHGHTDVSNKAAERAASCRKSPDGQFFYDGIGVPPFVIEVAYSQQEHEVQAKAKEYLKKLGVSTVLTIDIKWATESERQAPGHKHRATFCLWTAETIGDVLKIRPKKEVFREGGRALRGSLAIPFKSFLPPDKRTGTSAEDTKLRFSYRLLAKIVEQAEKDQRVSDTSLLPISPKHTKVVEYDEDGNLVKEEVVEPEAKRQKTYPLHEELMGTRGRTWLAHQQRKSSRLSSQHGLQRGINEGS
ncbi:hypothetical protein F5B21DRAFT_216156 [Xylaria acuta]|nr:hypothetical protein F5B21DRAFT_216156 [Xylaria acuta]